MKLLIFGGNGFVGGVIAKQARAQFATAIVSSTTNHQSFSEFQHFSANIANYSEVAQVFSSFRPQAVINAAAISDIDRSETNQELAYQVNVIGAKNIAQLCAQYQAKYLFFSSDAVFKGERALYSEEDQPEPVNYYGLTKYQAEQAVMAANPLAIVLRVSLVLGFPVAGGNSFLVKMKKSLLAQQEIICAEDEVRTPIDVLTLADAALELVTSNFSGIIHVAATQSLNRFDLAKKIAAHLKLNDHNIKANKAQANNNPNQSKAPRHKNGIIAVNKARSQLKVKMLDIDQTISKALGSENYFN